MIVTSFGNMLSTQRLIRLWPEGYDTARYGWVPLLREFPEAVATLFNESNHKETRITLYGENLDGWIPIPHAFLSNANVVGTSFVNAVLSYTRAYNAVFVDCDFTDCDLSESEFLNTTFIRCNFTRCNLSGIQAVDTYGLPLKDGAK